MRPELSAPMLWNSLCVTIYLVLNTSVIVDVCGRGVEHGGNRVAVEATIYLTTRNLNKRSGPQGQRHVCTTGHISACSNLLSVSCQFSTNPTSCGQHGGLRSVSEVLREIPYCSAIVRFRERLPKLSMCSCICTVGGTGQHRQ